MTTLPEDAPSTAPTTVVSVDAQAIGVAQPQLRLADGPTLTRAPRASANDAPPSNQEASAPVARPEDCQPQLRGAAKLDYVERSDGIGTFDPSIVTKEFNKRIRALQVCYEQKLRRDPSIQGSVLAEFTLESSGIVSRMLPADGSSNDPLLEACTEIVRRFRFNPGPEGGSVTYRFSVSFSRLPDDPAVCYRECGLTWAPPAERTVVQTKKKKN